jgi:hypothetical protein
LQSGRDNKGKREIKKRYGKGKNKRKIGGKKEIEKKIEGHYGYFTHLSI